MMAVEPAAAEVAELAQMEPAAAELVVALAMTKMMATIQVGPAFHFLNPPLNLQANATAGLKERTMVGVMNLTTKATIATN